MDRTSLPTQGGGLGHITVIVSGGPTIPGLLCLTVGGSGELLRSAHELTESCSAALKLTLYTLWVSCPSSRSPPAELAI